MKCVLKIGLQLRRPLMMRECRRLKKRTKGTRKMRLVFFSIICLVICGCTKTVYLPQQSGFYYQRWKDSEKRFQDCQQALRECYEAGLKLKDCPDSQPAP